MKEDSMMQLVYYRKQATHMHETTYTGTRLDTGTRLLGDSAKLVC